MQKVRIYCALTWGNADLRQTHIEGADLRGAHWNEFTMWPEGIGPVNN